MKNFRILGISGQSDHQYFFLAHDQWSWGECDGVGNQRRCTAFSPQNNREV